jgi:tetratricopeptide (TPR) repeat protein
VRDLDVARRAQQRGFITAEQFREAQQFAAGGRSVLSVLLDLGHLKADDLLRLGDAPGPARPHRLFGIATVAALGVSLLGALLWIASLKHEGPALAAPPPPEPPPAPAPSFQVQANRRARQILAGVEGARDARGRPSTDGDQALRRAAALMEESIAAGPADDDLLVLARIRELLDEWEASRDLYRRGVDARPLDLRGLLGAARLNLLLQDPASARGYADRACRVPNPPAEALFLRGAAALALGERAVALPDLAEASRMDAALQPRVEALRAR